jgi:hypothetical protein
MKCLANKSTELKVREKTVKQVVRIMCVVVASILTDKYGFGKAKTQQILKSMQDRADSLLKGYANIEDFEKVLNEEYDIWFD